MRYLLAFVAIALPCTALAIAAAVLHRFPFDQRMMLLIQDIGAWFDPVAHFVNDPGRLVVMVVLWPATILFFALTKRGDLAVVFALANLLRPLQDFLKAEIERPRPIGNFEVQRFIDDGSFPSGHVMRATIFFGLWFIVAAEALPKRWVLPVRVACAAFILGNVLARQYAGVHWLSDTYGGFLWGALVIAFVMALRPLFRRLLDAFHRARRNPPSGGLRTPQPAASESAA